VSVGFEIDYLRILVWTCLIEGLVLNLALVQGPWKTRLPWWKRLAAAIVPTAATLPHLWFVAAPFLQNRATAAAIAEPIIVLVESAILEAILVQGWKRSLVLAFLANLASWGAGELFPL